MFDRRASLHTTHDPLLVAAFAAGDATGEDLARAAALVSTCTACAALHRDLRALASALPAVPAPARPRDFALTATQAAAATRRTGWRRILASLGGARRAAAPLGASLAALGVAGLLLGGAIRLDLGGATSAIAPAASPAASDAAVRGGVEFATPGTKDTAPSADPVPSAAASAGVPAAVIDRMRAVEIARGARRAYATAGLIEVEIGTFADLGNAGVATDGPEPAPDHLVWAVNLGKELGPRSAAGAIVVIDARDGHVIQAFDWIS